MFEPVESIPSRSPVLLSFPSLTFFVSFFDEGRPDLGKKPDGGGQGGRGGLVYTVDCQTSLID